MHIGTNATAMATLHRKGLDEAINDVKNGRTTKCEDFDDYLKKINS